MTGKKRMAKPDSWMGVWWLSGLWTVPGLILSTTQLSSEGGHICSWRFHVKSRNHKFKNDPSSQNLKEIKRGSVLLVARTGLLICTGNVKIYFPKEARYFIQGLENVQQTSSTFLDLFLRGRHAFHIFQPDFKEVFFIFSSSKILSRSTTFCFLISNVGCESNSWIGKF